MNVQGILLISRIIRYSICLQSHLASIEIIAESHGVFSPGFQPPRSGIFKGTKREVPMVLFQFRFFKNMTPKSFSTKKNQRLPLQHHTLKLTVQP